MDGCACCGANTSMYLRRRSFALVWSCASAVFRSCLICQSRTFLKLRQGSCGSFLVSRVLSNRCSHNFLLSAACKICFQTPVISCIDEHLYRAATFNSRCPMCSPACTTTAHPMDTTLSSTRCGPWCGDGDDRFVGNLPRAPHESRDFQ